MVWRRAGYDLNRVGLSFEDWEALAVITAWQERQDQEALTAAFPVWPGAAK